MNRILTALGIASIIAAISFQQGYSYCKDKTDIAMLIQSQENAKKMAAIVIETEEKTRAIYEQKINLLTQVEELPDNCVLSPDFRRLHDSAAGLPEVSTASPVAAQAVAATVIDNYTACRQNAEWLEECNKICN